MPAKMSKMSRLLCLILSVGWLLIVAQFAFGQSSASVSATASGTRRDDTPAPKKRTVRRTSGVKVTEDAPPSSAASSSTKDSSVPVATASPSPSPSPTPSATPSPTPTPLSTATPTPAPTPDAQALRVHQAAAEAALEHERQRAADEARVEAKAEAETHLRKEREDAAARLKIEVDAAMLAREDAAREKSNRETLERETKEREMAASILNKEREDAARALSAEITAAKEREQTALREKNRFEFILQIARKLRFVDPLTATKFVAGDISEALAIELALAAAVRRDATLVLPDPTVATSGYCASRFVGEAITYDTTGDEPLASLLNFIRLHYNVSFLPDSEILNLPINVHVNDVAWNVALRTVLEDYGLTAECVASNTLHIVKMAKLVQQAESKRKTEPLVSTYIKLRYLQPSSGGLVNVAGKAQGGAQNVFETLEASITKLLRDGGDTRGTVSRVPNRAEFFVRATADQLADIKTLIAKADRPPYQVLVQALVYTANDSKTRNLGVRASVLVGTGNGSILGGLLTQSTGTTGTTGSGSGGSGSGSGASGMPQRGGVNPGGVPSLGQGFSQPTNALAAASPSAVLGISTILGTNQFSLEATALQQRGVINVQSRPFTYGLDGQSVSLDFGRQIPVVVQAASGAGGIATGQLEILNAGSTLQVTPQVAEDENGNPEFVTLTLRLEANDADTSIVTTTAPSLTRRAIQSSFRLRDDQTIIIGGFSTDSVTRSRSQVPGVSRIPVLGELFKQRLDQDSHDRLYFAIAVKIVPQDAPVPIDAPVDATPKIVLPPAPQSPSPYQITPGRNPTKP